MLTPAKIETYKRFNGDINRWIAETNGVDASSVTRADWELIKELRNYLNGSWTGQLNPEFEETFEAQLLESTANEQTRQLLHGLATEGWFQHPVLGPIIPELDKRFWWTRRLAFEGLGFEGRIFAFTKGEPPSQKQLGAMVKALNATPEMKDEMAGEMFNYYADLRSVYDEKDAPELHEPSDIWTQVEELSVHVDDDDENETTFSFRLKIDPGHEMNVFWKNDQIVDVKFEG